MTEESKKIRLRVGRLVVPILLVGFYVWYGSLILELPQGPGEEGPLGPSFIPWLWASLLIVLTLVEIATGNLGARRDEERVVIERKSALDALILCLLLAGFAVLMQYVGFSAAVIAFLAVSFWWSGIRSWKIIIPYLVIFAFVVNYVFHHVLKVPLPQDWLF
ncbi:MAG: tripartite tricarboxylate transporter TctB family protein [Nitrospinae bacterium]|nr:tripartite tricarboxylate transporter TctB family protein [Nitrospinota bacterium]